MNKLASCLKLRVWVSIFLILGSFLSGLGLVSCRSKGFRDGNRTLRFDEVDFRQYSEIGRIEKIVKLDASEAPSPWFPG
jgi:hypothetical protein